MGKAKKRARLAHSSQVGEGDQDDDGYADEHPIAVQGPGKLQMMAATPEATLTATVIT